MKAPQKFFWVAFSILGAVSCAPGQVQNLKGAVAEPQLTPVMASPAAMQATICQIRAESEKYFGRKVAISATYLTDGSIYSYLIDNNCDGKKILDLELDENSGNQSIRSFANFIETSCAIACAFEAQVQLEGVIVENKKHRPSLQVSRVVKVVQKPSKAKDTHKADSH